MRLGAQVVHAQHLLRREGVVGAQARHRGALDEPVGHEGGRQLVAGEHVEETEVERALGETLLDVGVTAGDHLDAARPVTGVEVAQGGGEQAGGRRVDRPDAQVAAAYGLLAGGLAQPVDGLEHLDHELLEVQALPADP